MCAKGGKGCLRPSYGRPKLTLVYIKNHQHCGVQNKPNIVLVFPVISIIVVLDELLFWTTSLQIVDSNIFMQIVVLDDFFATSCLFISNFAHYRFERFANYCCSSFYYFLAAVAATGQPAAQTRDARWIYS